MNSLFNKTIMVTGGTGSFGKSIIRKLLDANEISKIIVFSRDEKKQHDMRLFFNDERLVFHIGDIRDRDSINQAMKGVDFVFHAAALKHVPSCEFFPMEAVKTNIIGTDNVLEIALRNNVEKVVVLSTDKAAYPVNAMGGSKMMMEKLMIARAQNMSADSASILCGVRYGNVLYSRGSVLPLFFNQLEQNIPLTITDKRMTRFLMPLSDATELVLYALKNGMNGDLFIHKAKAATIMNLAKATFELTGINGSIKIIGVRGGEKMDETLATEEELARSQDLGDYWRIRCEANQENEYYLSHGQPEISNKDAFTSSNAAQLTVSQICQMLNKLPEIKKVLTKIKGSQI